MQQGSDKAGLVTIVLDAIYISVPACPPPARAVSPLAGIPIGKVALVLKIVFSTDLLTPFLFKL